MKKNKREKLLEYIAVLWIIVSSGFVVLNYIYMIESMIVLLIISLIYAYKYRTISKRNMQILINLFVYLLIDEIITLTFKPYPLVLNNVIVYGIRWISLAVIRSHMTLQKFKKTYINIITAIAVISVVCFVLVTFTSINLPFSGTYGDSTYYGTFYFQIKQNSLNYNRNTGPYGEAGMFSIALILGMTFLITDASDLFERKNFCKLLCLFIALMTTQSGTGMICCVCLLLLVMVKDFTSGKTLKHPVILLILIVMTISFWYVENTYGILQTKVIDQGGSYGVRMDDTILGYKIAIKNFFFGTGICNDYSSAWNNSLLEGSRSNGMANLAASTGIIFLCYYILRLFKRAREYSNKEIITTIVTFIILICVYNTQPVVVQTIGLTYLFDWRKEKNYGNI